jgi:hypothetical protein
MQQPVRQLLTGSSRSAQWDLWLATDVCLHLSLASLSDSESDWHMTISFVTLRSYPPLLGCSRTPLELADKCKHHPSMQIMTRSSPLSSPGTVMGVGSNCPFVEIMMSACTAQ